MRGASALAKLLQENPSPSLRLLVIWEPVIESDRGPPDDALAGTLADSRVERFWDPERRLSRYLNALLRAHPERAPGVELTGETIIWDCVMLFPAGARWDAELPPHAYAGMPVVRAIDALAARLAP